MNPNIGIAPQMSSNEGIRRILSRFEDANGLPLPGSPGGPLTGTSTRVTRVAATGPSPTVATLLIPARSTRRSLQIKNLDDNDTIWLDSNPNVTDSGSTAGTTLLAGQSISYPWNGAVYIYCTTGSPIAEATEILG